FEECSVFRLPRIVGHRIFPCKGLRWAHLRRHLIPGHAFRTITPAEPADFELTHPAGNLEREEVLPFCPTGMKKGYLAPCRLQQEKTVILHRHIPEVSTRAPSYAGEVAQKPAGEVDQMRPLIDQLAPARLLRHGAP